MVSFWPWKGSDSSPESFEKALSALSGKISVTSTRLEGHRQNARRLKALWTLYTSIAYLLYVIVVALVVGWGNWGATEYSAVAGAPVLIYLGRLTLETFYNYRISKLQAQLNALKKDRDSTIAKLKAATKYDSTQQLLEKYGETPARPKAKAPEKSKAKPAQQSGPQQNNTQQGRTGFAPPPTANIPGRTFQQPPPITPDRPTNTQAGPSPNFHHPSPPSAGPSTVQSTHADFAPNAFPAQHYAPAEGNKWYDRLMDVLLGEDESNPKNRLALICKKCRLVNGQAPPGTTQLEDVGKWKCSGCGTMNGEESEAKRVIEKLQEDAKERDEKREMQKMQEAYEMRSDLEHEVGDREGDSSDVTQYSEDEEEREILKEQQPKPKQKATRRSPRKKA